MCTTYENALHAVFPQEFTLLFRAINDSSVDENIYNELIIKKNTYPNVKPGLSC
jgi:hypothetical protein